MTTESAAVAEAIMRGNMNEARERLQNGEPLAGRYAENNRSQIINSIFRAKAFDLIDNLIEHGLIQTDVYEYDSLDRSVFKNIAMSLQGDEDSLNFLKDFTKKIQNKNDEVRDMTVLQFCIEEAADPAIIQCLIEEGFDPQYKNNAHMNLLHAVVNKGMLDETKGKTYIEILLSNGVDVNHRNVVGTTPLMLAVQRARKNYLDLLLQGGADPNEQDNKGNSSFYFAVVDQQNRSVYEKLKEYASPNFDNENKDGEYILTGYLRMANGSSPDVIGLLTQMLEDGADIYQASPYYSVPKSGVDWLAEKTPELLKAVLDNGSIEIDRQDDHGNTLLHKICAFNVNYEQEAAKRTYQKVKLLLQAGADPGIVNDKEETPMTLAAKDNLKAKTVDLLMQTKNN
jgi:ankyrin repeat protein